MTRPLPVFHARLGTLLPHLRFVLAQRGEAKVELPHGLIVQLYHDALGRERLRAGRREMPTDTRGLQKFAQEVEVLAKHLEVTTWRSVPLTTRRGIAIELLAPAPADARPMELAL